MKGIQLLVGLVIREGEPVTGGFPVSVIVCLSH